MCFIFVNFYIFAILIRDVALRLPCPRQAGAQDRLRPVPGLLDYYGHRGLGLID